MALTETDTNRAISSATNTQKAIANISWSADKENQPHATSASKTTQKQTSNINIDEIPDINPDNGFTIRYNCNQVRTKISAFINNGGMKVGEFQKKLGVSSKSYLSFMRQNGPHAGMGNNTYSAAHQFFTAMEDRGMKIPRAKKSTAGGKKGKEDDEKNDVGDIHLDGEESGTVPVWDTCDDIRTKINAHLRTESTTQAAFCRNISKCQGRDATPVQSGQLTAFLRKKGPMAGNTSKAFYASYVFFEKLRLKQNKPKSKKRLEVEEAWKDEGGVDTSVAIETRGIWASADEVVTMNKYGKIEIS